MIIPFDDLTGKTRDEIVAAYREMGFDDETAEAYTAAALGEVDNTLEEADEKPGEPDPDDVAKAVHLSIGAALKVAADFPGTEFEAQVRKAAASGADDVAYAFREGGDIYLSWTGDPGSVPVAKAVDEKRFTSAPVYIPGQYDSDGDWSDPDTIQQAVWDFNRGDRLIAVQHHPELGPVGEVVELAVIPFEHDVEMHKANGSSYMQHFPAGTPWMGVVWNERVWPLVKEGKLNGYSIGGTASLVNVDLPPKDVAKAFNMPEPIEPKRYDVDFGESD